MVGLFYTIIKLTIRVPITDKPYNGINVFTCLIHEDELEEGEENAEGEEGFHIIYYSIFLVYLE